MTNETKSNAPALNIYTKVPDNQGGTRLGSKIGVGFTNSKGFNIILDAQPLPLNGRIELVAFKNTPKPTGN